VLLADSDDVASALGLPDAEALTEEQSARVDGLLERVSDAFQRLTGRVFADGATTVRAAIVDGRARLPSVVSEVTAVSTVDGDELDFDVDGNCVTVTRNGRLLVTGTVIVVDYVCGDVPAGIRAFVAQVVARHLSVNPDERKAVDVSSGPFRERLADWATSTGLFTPDELADINMYRDPHPTVVIHRL